MSNDATTTERRASPTIPAGIGTPRSARVPRASWLADREAELLPVPYFHVVFTLPARVAAIAFHNKAAVYAILFRTAAEALLTIAVDEFIRRFLLHVLPNGFHHIRHYGLLANAGRADNLARCRRLIAADHPPDRAPSCERASDDGARSKSDLACACPDCGGLMRRIAIVPRSAPGPQPFSCDTS
jgi:hypothetical protein